MHDLLFCALTLWLNYVTVTFLLVSSSSTNHDLLCFVYGQGQKNRTKTERFAKLHNHLPLLTMVNHLKNLKLFDSECECGFMRWMNESVNYQSLNSLRFFEVINIVLLHPYPVFLVHYSINSPFSKLASVMNSRSLPDFKSARKLRRSLPILFQ